MTHQQILEKAIQKAIDGGWEVFGHKSEYESAKLTRDAISGMPTVLLTVRNKGRVFGYGGIPLLNILYSHDFAKALWGNSLNVEVTIHHNMDFGSTTKVYEGWEYMLQQMVIADDPVKYLGDHLND